MKLIDDEIDWKLKRGREKDKVLIFIYILMNIKKSEEIYQEGVKMKIYAIEII